MDIYVISWLIWGWCRCTCDIHDYFLASVRWWCLFPSISAYHNWQHYPICWPILYVLPTFKSRNFPNTIHALCRNQDQHWILKGFLWHNLYVGSWDKRNPPIPNIITVANVEVFGIMFKSPTQARAHLHLIRKNLTTSRLNTRPTIGSKNKFSNVPSKDLPNLSYLITPLYTTHRVCIPLIPWLFSYFPVFCSLLSPAFAPHASFEIFSSMNKIFTIQ